MSDNPRAADRVADKRDESDNPRRVHPLGPLVRMVPLASLEGRLYAVGMVAVVTALFVVAGRLHPDGYDQGVHEQLGLPPCGFLVVVGLPCPTCGMTTAFAHTIHGHWFRAIHAQPAGFLLAVTTLAIGLTALMGLLTGRRPVFNWYRINPVTVVWVGCVLFILGWGVKLLLYLLAHRAA